MAKECIRKSNRIKTRRKMNYMEDVSAIISSISETHIHQKSKGNSGKACKSLSSGAKRPDKKRKICDLDSNNDNNNTSSVKNTSLKSGEILKNQATDIQDCSQLVCLVCKKNLASQKELDDHIVKHQSQSGRLNGGFICNICNRTCVDEGAYNRHMKSHSGNRKHKCDICDKAFAESCSLKRHFRSHDDDRPFTCDLCFKSFRDHPSLMRHHKTHTDRPRMYQCIKCDKNFADKHGLKRHERTHTGIRPFECQICFKTFSESGSFKRHQKIHTGIRNYFCPVCNKSFLEKQSLIRHQKNVCGFGNRLPLNNSSINSSFDMDQSRDTTYSGPDNSEISHASFDEVTLINYNHISQNSSNFKSSNSISQAIKTDHFISPSDLNRNKNKPLQYNRDALSLHSLIKKDPNLYDSISEIVESIDSYEKMLDLCGDSGQKQLDAVLTRDPIPMPDNLLCFECGEVLVDGDNFKSKGKSFHPSLTNSYKCLICEEEEEDYGDPPVLTAELPVSESASRYDYSTVNPESGQHFYSSLNSVKLNLVRADNASNKIIFGTEETIENFRERLKVQHGVYFIGDGYSNGDVGSDTSNHAHSSYSDATYSCSNSTDNISDKPVTNQAENDRTLDIVATVDNSLYPISSLGINAHGLSSSNQIYFRQASEQEKWDSATPKMEYEADDPNIPSVFPCHLCTKVFATSAFLERHLGLHKKSPYRCMMCGKSFTNAPGLKRHITTHTGEKPYCCPYCQKQFRDPSNFSKHKKLCAASVSALSPTDSNLSVSAGKKSAISSHNQSMQFSYDRDEEEDLPVSFGPNTENSVAMAETKIDKSSEETETFNDISNILREGSDNSMLIPCPICAKMFGNAQYLEMHMKYHTGNPNVTCIECGKSFADPCGLKRHLRIHAGIRPHICEYCHRGYCDNWSLKKHKSRGCQVSEIKVPVNLLNPCQQCNRVFADFENLHEHTKTHKGMPKFECDICQKRFSEAFNLKRHRRLHMAICLGCEKEFRDIQSLNKHRVTDCPGNTTNNTAPDKVDGFPCPECGRVYSSKVYLERHKKFHSDLKPYVCDICNKKFSEGFRLRRHMKVHTGTKPFNCKDCGKTFHDETSLKRHMAHTTCKPDQKMSQQQPGAQAFPCHLCHKVFAKNYLLVRHMNVHSQERPFVCDVCDRSYKDISSLKRHQLVHQGVKEFVCPICGKDFFYSDSLKRHMAGSCGKTKSRRRRYGHGKGKKKSNNNICMKNNNATELNILSSDIMAKFDGSKETDTAEKKSPSVHKKLYTIVRSRLVKVGHWSCLKKQQCWRCNIKVKSVLSLLHHARSHQHKKPFYCPFCYMRWAKKFYQKIHLRTHKSIPVPKQHVHSSSQNLEKAKIVKRPQRSIPRARWSWISQI